MEKILRNPSFVPVFKILQSLDFLFSILPGIRFPWRILWHLLMLNTYRHACNFCGKRFITTSKLNRHTLMHTGERPYICQFCYEPFSKASNMKLHTQTIQKIHGVDPVWSFQTSLFKVKRFLLKLPTISGSQVFRSKPKRCTEIRRPILCSN